MHAQGYTQVRGPLARLLLGTHRVARRCAGRWPACCWARAGLRSGARASGPPFDLRAQIRQPLARPLICARARLRLDARASGPPVVGHAQGYAQVREPLARLSICANAAQFFARARGEVVPRP